MFIVLERFYVIMYFLNYRILIKWVYVYGVLWLWVCGMLVVLISFFLEFFFDLVFFFVVFLIWIFLVVIGVLVVSILYMFIWIFLRKYDF